MQKLNTACAFLAAFVYIQDVAATLTPNLIYDVELQCSNLQRQVNGVPREVMDGILHSVSAIIPASIAASYNFKGVSALVSKQNTIRFNTEVELNHRLDEVKLTFQYLTGKTETKQVKVKLVDEEFNRIRLYDVKILGRKLRCNLNYFSN